MTEASNFLNMPLDDVVKALGAGGKKGKGKGQKSGKGKGKGLGGKTTKAPAAGPTGPNKYAKVSKLDMPLENLGKGRGKGQGQRKVIKTTSKNSGQPTQPFRQLQRYPGTRNVAGAGGFASKKTAPLQKTFAINKQRQKATGVLTPMRSRQQNFTQSFGNGTPRDVQQTRQPFAGKRNAPQYQAKYQAPPQQRPMRPLPQPRTTTVPLPRYNQAKQTYGQPYRPVGRQTAARPWAQQSFSAPRSADQPQRAAPRVGGQQRPMQNQIFRQAPPQPRGQKRFQQSVPVIIGGSKRGVVSHPFAGKTASTMRPTAQRSFAQKEPQWAPPPRRPMASSGTTRRQSDFDTRWAEERPARREPMVRDRDERPLPDSRVGGLHHGKKKWNDGGMKKWSVRVSNIPSEFTREDIQGAFADHFNIADCHLKGGGVAIVTFKNAKDASSAQKQFDGGEMNEHKIRVQMMD